MSLYALQNILGSIGFKDKEASVYLANLKIGTNRPSIIAKEANLNRSTAYFLLEGLKKKGFVMEIKKENLKLYTAVEPVKILNYLKYEQAQLGFKIEDLAESLSKFNVLKTKYHSSPAVNLLEGENAIIFAHEDMLVPKNLIRSILFVSSMDEKIKKYLDKWNRERIYKKIPIKIITDEKTIDEVQGLFIEEFFEARFSWKEFDSDSTINICGNKIYIISYKEKSVILIENPFAANSLKQMFDLLWLQSSQKYKAKQKTI